MICDLLVRLLCVCVCTESLPTAGEKPAPEDVLEVAPHEDLLPLLPSSKATRTCTHPGEADSQAQVANPRHDQIAEKAMHIQGRTHTKSWRPTYLYEDVARASRPPPNNEGSGA